MNRNGNAPDHHPTGFRAMWGRRLAKLEFLAASRARASMAALVIALSFVPASVHAEHAAAPTHLPIPASLYPAGATIVTERHVTNAQMDESWGRDALDQPFMHVHLQSELHRLSGWMEAAAIYHPDSFFIDCVFVSDYESGAAAWNQVAFRDWQKSVLGIWNLPLAKSQPHNLLPSSAEGYAETRLIPADQGGPTVTIAGWWGQSREVEALAIFSPGMMSLTTAKRMLADQVRYAVRLS
jgi:hypothetical protein